MYSLSTALRFQCHYAALSIAFKRADFNHVIAALLVSLPLLCSLGLVQAQDDKAVAVDQKLDGLRKKITQIQETIEGKVELNDATLSQMKTDALAASTEADNIAKELNPQLSSVQARLAELGTPAAGTKETADVIGQRSQLDRDNRAVDAQVKLARLLIVEADQLSEQVTTVRRAQLQARLGERSASILAAPFWRQLQDEFPQNAQRLRTLMNEIGNAASSTPIMVWATLLVGMLTLLLSRIWAGRYLMTLTSTRVPHGRLRRSVHALTLTLLSVATPFLIAELLKLGLRWNSVLSEKTSSFLGNSIGAICFGGFVAGLGYALLSPGRPSWRLLPLHDRVAHRMRHFPAAFASIMVLVWVAESLSAVINTGLSTAVAINCIVALLLGATIALGLRRAVRVGKKVKLEDPEHTLPTSIWLRVVAILLWLALATSAISLLVGYVAFGSFIAKQVSWIIVIVSGTYLLAVLVDDVCMLLSSTDPEPNQKNPVLATPQARDQAAVLLSGAGRIIVILLAIMLLLAPFGEGPAELLHRIGQLDDGLAIGEILIRPGSVIQAMMVLVFGFFGLRLLKHWLETRYLPTTNLDNGMQVSAATLFGYAGGVIAVALALSALGIGLERIAWVASALSVGIGFGLQAVVQNFVSGLILLAERPVKVGDWVSLGGVEGDIRRINVRATEIQMGDRSTVIVPNSEFITKTVRNVTHASPLGLVQIKLPLPLDIDAEQARILILQTFIDNQDILATPEPSVQLDGIDNGYLMFNATGFASSPRLAYGVRSTLLFDLLKRLRDADIPVSKPNTMMLSTSPPISGVPLNTPDVPVVGPLPG
jgi:small-conductance mechanosensitive channel